MNSFMDWNTVNDQHKQADKNKQQKEKKFYSIPKIFCSMYGNTS